MKLKHLNTMDRWWSSEASLQSLIFPSGVRAVWGGLFYSLLFLLTGCQSHDPRQVITLWHQMVPKDRVVLHERIARFEADHPDLRIRTLYKETEELRSGFQAAALAGAGPDLVYGASDVLETFQTMGILADMSPWVDADFSNAFREGALTYLPSRHGANKRELVQIPDRYGNHLALVYNRNFIAVPPRTTDEMIRLGKAHTLDTNGDGRPDRYGLVWNYIEPFFAIPFLTGYGGWVFAETEEGGETVASRSTDHPVPALDTPESVAAYRFILALRDREGIVPRNCDYETADSLFKTGHAAMIINGDWSWADYLATEGIDAAVAPLPTVSSTGLPMRPMVSPKGYSLNANADSRASARAMEFVHFMTGVETQREFMLRQRILPSRKALYQDPFLREDPTLVASVRQLERGRLMPVATELRAVWDAMRPHYQSLLGGNKSPREAARDMQIDALHGIDRMRRTSEASRPLWQWQWAGLLAAGGLLFWQRRSLAALLPDLRRQPVAYLFVLPAVGVIFLTVVFPFFYNVLLSFSNMSLTHFQDWQITGWRNYAEVFTEGIFYGVLAKTVFWTVINVTLHVTIGLMLALALNGPIRGKVVYRIMLIIPWAVPAYITALTWRSMLHLEYGAVNLLAERFYIYRLLGIEPINWLGDPTAMFAACIITNVWLGFPFMMVIVLGGLQGIPTELYEAARIDRASRWQQFVHVTLPLLKPVLVPAITLGAIWTFNNLNVIWLVSNGGEPADQTHILVSYVYKAVFNLYRYGYGAALSMVIFFLLLAFSLLFLQRSRATENVYG